MLFLVGIDPGGHGAVSIVSLDGKDRTAYAFNKYTKHDLKNILIHYRDFLDVPLMAYIEEVHSMPNNGRVQAFSFGENYGFWLGLLTGLDIPYETVLPVKWQSVLKLRTRGLEYKQRKNALKGHAQRLYPSLNPTLDTCDALLIAEYGRRLSIEQRKAAR